MRIAIVSPEAVPFAKTGGLADVAGALPKELAQAGHEVRLIMPKYRAVDAAKFGLVRNENSLLVPLGDKTVAGEIFTSSQDGFTAIFIGNDEYFTRDELYGNKTGDFPDNASRFTFFSKGVLQCLKRLEFVPDVIHVNDWQSATIPLFLKSIYRNDPFFRKTATLLTIHNLGYQGLFWHLDMPLLGVGWTISPPRESSSGERSTSSKPESSTRI